MNPVKITDLSQVTLSYNVASSTPRNEWDLNSKIKIHQQGFQSFL